MTYPLQLLLQRDELGLRLICGDAQTPIAWVHGIELLDPTPYLDGGELVLTTGQRLPDDGAAITGYIQRLVNHGVAALGYDVGVHHSRIPSALIQACQQEGLTLLEVPEPTPFAAISRAGAQQLAQQEQAALVRASDFQRRLNRLATREGIHGVLRATAAHLRRPVVLLSDGRVSGDMPGPLELALADVVERLPHPARVYQDDTVECHPLLGRSGTDSWVITTSQVPMAPLERLTLQHAGTLLALLLDNPDDVHATHRRVGAQLVRQLARPMRPTASGLEEHDAAAILRELVPDSDSYDVCVIVPPALNPTQTWQQRVAQRLAAYPLVAISDDEAIALLPPQEHELTFTSLHIGVCPEQGETTVQSRIELARAAAQRARALERARMVSGDFDMAQLLLTDAGIAHLTATLRERLALLDADVRDALVAFIEANGVADQAARELGIHRQTLTARVKRAAQALDIDTADVAARTALTLTFLRCPQPSERTGASTPDRHR